MQVSVIVPVYNAASFVTLAVESALAVPEIGEILLIEDGSSDNSLEICRNLSDKDERVKLLRHPGGQNLGAGASRNIGIQRAACDYIAFLDADDLYLPERFLVACKVFESEPMCDGVYEATGVFFEDENAKERWESQLLPTLTTIHLELDPQAVFETMVTCRFGQFCTDGIVVRRELFDRAGYFDPTLRMCQDTHLWLRMAAVGCLLPGQIKQAVSLRRVHSGNRVGGRISVERRTYQKLMWRDLIEWGNRQKLSESKMKLLTRTYVRQLHQMAIAQNEVYSPNLQTEYLWLAQTWPAVLQYGFFWSSIWRTSMINGLLRSIPRKSALVLSRNRFGKA